MTSFMISVAAVNAADAGVGVCPGYGVLAHVSVAAEQLQAPVHDPPLQFSAPPLCLGGVDRGQLVGVQCAHAVVDVVLGHIDLGGDLGEHEAGVLERTDGMPER